MPLTGKVFGAAYNISNGGKKSPKIEHVADAVLDPLWRGRLVLRPKRASRRLTPGSPLDRDWAASWRRRSSRT